MRTNTVNILLIAIPLAIATMGQIHRCSLAIWTCRWGDVYWLVGRHSVCHDQRESSPAELLVGLGTISLPQSRRPGHAGLVRGVKIPSSSPPWPTEHPRRDLPHPAPHAGRDLDPPFTSLLRGGIGAIRSPSSWSWSVRACWTSGFTPRIRPEGRPVWWIRQRSAKTGSGPTGWWSSGHLVLRPIRCSRRIF